MTRDDVLEARVLRARDPSGRNGGGTEGRLDSRSGAPPSYVVRLGSSALVRDVMRARRALNNNYLTTNDIDSELLGPALAFCMPNNKIFINEKLTHEKLQAFKSLRSIAQKMGFKYVWHSGGRFLARYKGGEHAHSFVTAADFQTIHTACQSTPDQPVKKTQNVAVTRGNKDNRKQGAAQATGSAQAP